MNGLVLIDKPAGCTSHDVVNRWRKLAGTKRVGHLGTLDPMATGLLLLLSGNATRLAPYFRTDEKTYVAEIRFGCTSNTYDREGVIAWVNAEAQPALGDVEAALESFRGTFEQMPPPVSAKKISGVPAYKLARKQVEFTLKPAVVHVHRLDLLGLHGNQLRIEVRSSAGTYIRSIAHDLGQALGCGAMLTALRRTSVGDFAVEQAHSLDALHQMLASGTLPTAVIPTGRMLAHLPAQFMDEEGERHIRNGREFRTSPFVVAPGAPQVRAITRSGELIAIGELRYPNVYQPKVVL